MSELIPITSVLPGDTLEVHPFNKPKQIVEVVSSNKDNVNPFDPLAGIMLRVFNPKDGKKGVSPELHHIKSLVTLISRIGDDGEVIYY